MKFPYPLVPSITPDLTGFYRIPHEAYHQGVGISSSQVKKALKSYAAYTSPENTDSDALAFGRAFHMHLLEPGLALEAYRRIDLATRKSRAWDLFAAECHAKGKEPLLDCEDDQIMLMCGAIYLHPEYAKLPEFDAEIMAINRCPDTGLQIKCKADLFGHAIVDFKSTSSGVTPAEFLNDVIKWNYHVSAAFYQDVIWLCTGERLPFVVVPVTKKAPFECEFYTLSDEMLEEGRKLYKAGLKRIRNWSLWPESERITTEKKMRTLYPNGRLLYSTLDTLRFIEG